LNEQNVEKYLSKSTVTAKCHLNQQRQNTRSKKIRDAETIDTEPDPDQGLKTQYVYAATIDTGQIYTDQTGRFPVVTSKENKYIMVLYDYDSNAILAQPIKNRTAPELLKAFQFMEQELVAKGLKPKLMKLDNEASQLLKDYLYKQEIASQLVPPYSHRRNSAERAIISFKDHLITGLCSTDKAFPMHLWDRILPQAVITLNMIRTSRINPKLSAATHIFGQHDYNRALMAPPGTMLIAHETPGRRQTWAPHGQDGWYTGPALEHYRCYTVLITKTRSSRIAETVKCFPHQFKIPFPSSRYLATQAATELTHALLNPQPAGPFCQVGDEQAIALRKLATIFEASKPNKVNKQLTSQSEKGNNAPQRVQTTVSPPRVDTQNPNQRPIHHMISSHSPHNSHRRQQTPLRRVVTPLSHGMVRRSARQQSLSEDMMAETLAQANHCFSLAANSTCCRSSNPTSRIALSPEMANAVICPDTGKSLKHQELITKLKYKNNWMRSTENEINRLYNTDTIRFIQRSSIPKGRKVTYGSFVVNIKDHKEERERTRLEETKLNILETNQPKQQGLQQPKS
jgi:hypothetical protein